MVSLRQACPACDAAVVGTAAECPRCELARPAAGWVPVDTSSSIGQMDERVDDPETASSAPPPVVPVSPTVAATPAPFVLSQTEEPSLTAILVRFFGIFLLSAVITALLVTLVGMRFLPEKSAPSLVMTPAPVQPAVVPVAPAVADVDTEPDSDSDDAEFVIVPAPEPVVAPQPAVVAVAVPAPVVVPPAPVVEDIDTEIAVEVIEPVPEPEPEVSRVPEAARALTGTYIGRADGNAISMELTMGPDQVLTAVLRVAGRSGTEVHRVSGTYTLTPDGAADFALSDRTDDGVVGYSGTISGVSASGIVTVDGRRRGRFSVGK